jgi:hypothetical protein
MSRCVNGVRAGRSRRRSSRISTGWSTGSRGRGIEPAQRETYPNGVRKVIYRDPDGNELGFGGLPSG